MTTRVIVEVADNAQHAVRVELANQHLEPLEHPCYREVQPGEFTEFYVWSLQSLRVTEIPFNAD